MSDNIFLRAAARIKSIISAASSGKLYKSEKSVSVGRAFRSGTCPNAVRHVPPAERNKVPLASINNGKFYPAENLTRGVAAEWLVNGLYVVKGAGDQLHMPSGNKFSDVPADSAQSEKINIAAENGLITGYTDHTFRPNNTLTRAEAAAMMIRLCDFEKWAEDALAYPSYINTDMLPQLDEKKRNALFTQFVCPLTVHSTIQDAMNPEEDVARAAFWISLEYGLPLQNFGGTSQTINGVYYSVFLKDDFDRLVRLLYGKSYDLSKYACSSLPASSEDSAQMGFLINGKFYLRRLGVGSTGTPEYAPRHLFPLGGNRYFAMYEYWHHEMGDSAGTLEGEYAAIIEQLSNGGLTVVERYPANQLPTEADLSAFGAPQTKAA